ncbi:MAG: transcription antitermination factor NusB, partial [Bacillota bacterium]
MISLPKISARAMALEILYLVDQEEAYSNLALNSVLEKYRPEKQDRGFVTELAYGALRTQNTLDWVLGRFLKKPVTGLTPWIRNILRSGVYQLMFMDRVPVSAAVNESVNLAKRYGHKGTVGLVNGVLRNVVRSLPDIAFPDPEKEPVQHIAVKYSHPEWLVKRWLKEYGFTETVELCKANNEIPPNAVRTNTLRISRAELKNRLEDEGLQVMEGHLAPETLIIE